jgi:lysine biosynthesis protein LysW
MEHMTAETKNIAECPDCGNEVRFKKNPFLGQVTTCRSCDALLEVVNRFPIELDWVDPDWDDEADEYESSKPDRRKDFD